MWCLGLSLNVGFISLGSLSLRDSGPFHALERYTMHSSINQKIHETKVILSKVFTITNWGVPMRCRYSIP